MWVLGAKKVQVKTEDGVTPLKMDRPTRRYCNTWTGLVDFDPSKLCPWMPVTIQASYGMYEDKFTTLYSYPLTDPQKVRLQMQLQNPPGVGASASEAAEADFLPSS